MLEFSGKQNAQLKWLWCYVQWTAAGHDEKQQAGEKGKAVKGMMVDRNVEVYQDEEVGVDSNLKKFWWNLL